MTNDMKADSVETNAQGQWQHSVLRIAVISAVFAAIVATGLIFNYLSGAVRELEREADLTELKKVITDQPENTQMVELVRDLDLRARKARTDRVWRSKVGAYLLLGSVVIFLVCVKSLQSLSKKVVSPVAPGGACVQVQEAMLARRAVVWGGIIVLAGAIALAVWPVVDFEKATPENGTVQIAAPTYPSTEEVYANWPSFRGPAGSGVSEYTNIITDFDSETGRGIIWKSPVRLDGLNSPVVWGDRVFISGADESQREVYCYDAKTGELLWTGDCSNIPARTSEVPEVMEDTGFAACTMVTDGKGVCAIFANGDIACFDYSGKRIWAKNLGLPDSNYGYATSLAMYQDKVIVQFDQAMPEDGKSRLIAMKMATGQVAWRKERPVGNSWASPIVAKIGEGFQLITCSDPWVIAYDPDSGDEIWRAESVSGDVAPSPIYAGGLVFAIEPDNQITAIRPDGRGNVTETHIAWVADDGVPDICSPVGSDEYLLLLTSSGTLTCYAMADGSVLWYEDFRMDFLSSPSIVGGLLYLFSDEAEVIIVEIGKEYKEAGRCKLAESCGASPAFADGFIYMRAGGNLWCIGNTN